MARIVQIAHRLFVNPIEDELVQHIHLLLIGEVVPGDSDIFRVYWNIAPSIVQPVRSSVRSRLNLDC